MSEHEDCCGCQYGQFIKITYVVSTYPDIPMVTTKTQCCLRRQTFKGKGPCCPNYHKREENENND